MSASCNARKWIAPSAHSIILSALLVGSTPPPIAGWDAVNNQNQADANLSQWLQQKNFPQPTIDSSGWVRWPSTAPGATMPTAAATATQQSAQITRSLTDRANDLAGR
jgi:hypothetical protein